MINLASGCDYHIIFRDGTAITFRFCDTQGGIRIEVPPGGNDQFLDQLLQQHGGLAALTFLGCPNP